MNTWIVLQKELNYHGIHLISNKKCQLYNEDGSIYTQGIIKTIKQIVKEIRKQKKVLLFLWQEVLKLLEQDYSGDSNNSLLLDEKSVNLFIFSLKDISKFLLCFEDMDKSIFRETIEKALNKDIKMFNESQIKKLPDYKISIDWIHRLIHRLMYIAKLLSYAAIGQESIAKYIMKMARGISGPWSRLDLPMEERIWPFEDDFLFGRMKDKQNQRRYRKHLENYNSTGAVGEGHLWREIKNEPFSWYDRSSDDPYPHRSLLNY